MQVNLRLDQEAYETLRLLCAQQRVTASVIVARLLAEVHQCRPISDEEGREARRRLTADHESADEVRT